MPAKKFLSGIDLASQQIKHLADGAANDDAATYGQLLALVNGAIWKDAAQVASTANLDLAAPGASIDQVALSNGDRVLVKNQTDPTENGIYVWNGATSTMTRASDADGTGELDPGSAVFVLDGTVNSATAWIVADQGTTPIDPGTDDVVWTQFGAGGTLYSAGDGLQLIGTTFSVEPDPAGGLLAAASGVSVKPGTGIVVDENGVSVDPAAFVRKFAQDIGNGTLTSIAVTHGLGTRDVTVAIYDNATFAEVETDVVHTDANTVTLNFATAPATGAYRVVVNG